MGHDYWISTYIVIESKDPDDPNKMRRNSQNESTQRGYFPEIDSDFWNEEEFYKSHYRKVDVYKNGAWLIQPRAIEKYMKILKETQVELANVVSIYKETHASPR